MTAVLQAKENVIATARAKPEAGSNPEVVRSKARLARTGVKELKELGETPLQSPAGTTLDNRA
jgi:hypothetical protein